MLFWLDCLLCYFAVMCGASALFAYIRRNDKGCAVWVVIALLFLSAVFAQHGWWILFVFFVFCAVCLVLLSFNLRGVDETEADENPPDDDESSNEDSHGVIRCVVLPRRVLSYSGPRRPL